MAGRRDGPGGRTIVVLMLGLMLPVFPSSRLPGQDVNALPNPALVPQRERTTARDDDAIVQALEHRIRCTCGCGLDVFVCRTTDFTCTTSPAMHKVVLARLDSAMTPEQVVAAFEAQYGQSILMQPPKRGFNWAAYLVPFLALGAGLTLLLWAMGRWVRRDGGTVGRGDGTPTPSTGPPVSPSPEVERLQRELEKFEA